MLIRKQAGDTLVEVALAMAILGAVIALAYSVSNRAVRLGRDAKERNEAAQLQQYQAEALRNVRDNYGWTTFKGLVQPRLLTPAQYDVQDPCTSNVITNSRRFYLRGRSSGKLLPIQDGHTPADFTGDFTQCITARGIGNSADPNYPSQVRFDIYITWDATNGDTNKSVLTVQLADTANIPAGTP